jgi:hypothetical protein
MDYLLSREISETCLTRAKDAQLTSLSLVGPVTEVELIGYANG